MDPGPPTPHGCLSLESELGASRARESTLQTNIGAHDGKRAEGALCPGAVRASFQPVIGRVSADRQLTPVELYRTLLVGPSVPGGLLQAPSLRPASRPRAASPLPC